MVEGKFVIAAEVSYDCCESKYSHREGKSAADGVVTVQNFRRFAISFCLAHEMSDGLQNRTVGEKESLQPLVISQSLSTMPMLMLMPAFKAEPITMPCRTTTSVSAISHPFRPSTSAFFYCGFVTMVVLQQLQVDEVLTKG